MNWEDDKSCRFEYIGGGGGGREGVGGEARGLGEEGRHIYPALPVQICTHDRRACQSVNHSRMIGEGQDGVLRSGRWLRG